MSRQLPAVDILKVSIAEVLKDGELRKLYDGILVNGLSISVDCL